MNEIIEYIAWAFREKPMFATLVCAVFSFINLLIAFHFLKKAKGQRMAMFLVENQFNSVSQADIETHFFGRATGEQLTESQRLMTRLRAQVGHDGVKWGHLFFLAAIIHGDIEEPEVFPDFDKGMSNA